MNTTNQQTIPVRVTMDDVSVFDWNVYICECFQKFVDFNILESLRAHSHVFSARTEDGKLVGIARLTTDEVVVGFLSDLSVHPDYRNHGIGTALLKAVLEYASEIHKKSGLYVTLSTEAEAEKSFPFYERNGFTRHTFGFNRQITE